MFRYSAMVLVALPLALAGTAFVSAAVPSYNVIDLGMLGGNYSCAYGINNNGDVVGTNGSAHAFLYRSGTMTDLGVLPGCTESAARGINASGQIVGYSQTSGGINHAFLLSNGTMSDLGTLGGSGSVAWGINGNGQVVGNAETSIGSYTYHAFLSTNGTMNDLRPVGGSISSANAINESGQIAGEAQFQRFTSHAFLYSNGTMNDLGNFPGGSDSFANGINAAGQVVGYGYSSSGDYHAFLYSHGTMSDLGTLGGPTSWAWGINDSGQIVGSSGSDAFLDSDGTMYDLNSLIGAASGWSIDEAYAINDNGWIAGQGINSAGKYHAVLLVPVPEPSTIALLLGGAIGLLTYGRRRTSKGMRAALMLLSLLVFPIAAQADVFNMGGTRNPVTGAWTGQASLEFVTVGDAGNAPDTRWAESPYYRSPRGDVVYTYQIGKFDVTGGQYAEFLNAVAKTDPYNIYNWYTAMNPAGCKIQRSGGSGSYSYTVTPEWANRPVNYVSWGGAARFVNWLQNGQPTGILTGSANLDAGLTENGAYDLHGAVADTALMAVTRNAGAKYFLPTENEWYKAAYYKGNGANAGYWTYPTESDSPPNNVLDPTGTNNANYHDYISPYTGNGGYTDSADYVTAVGAFAASPGPYGTFDQGGNVYQWNETPDADQWRGLLGGAFAYDVGTLAGHTSVTLPPSSEDNGIGFRVASVAIPEPSSIAILLAGAVGLLAYAWRRRCS